MTADERALVMGLAEVWNRYMELPEEHPMDRQEFCMLVHHLQHMVLARPARRALKVAGPSSASLHTGRNEREIALAFGRQKG